MRIVIVALLLGTACEHVTQIETSPPGGIITVNGERLGQSPVTLKETTGWRRSYLVEAELKDHVVVKKRIEQSEWNLPLTATAVCCSLGLGSPLSGIGVLPLSVLFFSRQLPDEVVIALEPVAAPAPPAGEAPPVKVPDEPVVPTPFSY